MKRSHITIGIAITILLFMVHLLVIDDYGITWDFHHHFFAGLYHLGIPMKEELTRNIPFTVPDPRGTYDLPFGPLMLIAPTITYQLFHETLGLLAFDNAYHLSIIISGVVGVFILYLFLLEAFGFTTALAGFAFLALLPRYWGDLHNNMKDVPQAAAFALAIWMFWRLTRTGRLKDLLWASLAFAIAFNTKVNTLLVPVIAGFWWMTTTFFSVSLSHLKHELRIRNHGKTTQIFSCLIHDSRFLILYFLAAPAAAFLLWLPFWAHPVERLLYMFRFFLDNTQNLEVLYFGTIYRSAINVPWHYPLGYLAITTPIPVLAFFLIGLMSLMRQIRQKPIASLLLLWFFLPLARYAFPRMGVIDGIRHFEEVVFPLAAIAAIGASSVFALISRSLSKRNVNAVAVATTNTILFLLLLVWLIIPVVRYHPYQISYFNELVGGVRGAWKNFDVEYWGTSQKAAMRWLNANARKNSFVHILMAGDAAAKYLRPDLLARVNQKGFDDADYVVVLNRQSFFNRYWGTTDYMTRHKIAYTVSVLGVPLTMIYETKKQ